jgi:hypothetical protein
MRRRKGLGILVIGMALQAGCHAGKHGGALAPDRAPYSAARPIYAPTPINPLYISGYAGRSRPAPPPRVVVPNVPGAGSRPALLP